jgi:hypothetical protein
MLLRRVFEINASIGKLRRQQLMVLDLVEAESGLEGAKVALHSLESLGREAGIDKDNYARLHGEFERSSPEAHRRLLAFLGFSEKDIAEFLAHIEKSL